MELRERCEHHLPLASRFHLAVPSLTIRRMVKRWGSCTRRGRILLNPELIRTPSDCIDYVIVQAGVILVVGLFLILAPALQLYSLVRASGDNGPMGGIPLPRAIIVVGVFAIATAVRSYPATRRRRRAVPEGDATE